MKRREFLARTSAALAATAWPSCRDAPDWSQLRLVVGSRATELERTAAEDAAALFEEATVATVEVVSGPTAPGPCDVVVGTPESLGGMVPPPGRTPGSYEVGSVSAGRVVVSGADAEGARNGLYAFMEHLGFRFFRDGDVVPELRGPEGLDGVLEAPLRGTPTFRLRGDMIWDNYLGPRRYCAAAWGEEEWERALLFMARNRMNFLEYYPPLASVLARVFPKAEGLDEGVVWRSEVEHRLAKNVLARARSLGIRSMYVLSYGAFPEPVRKLFPDLEWRNGFLCAHQPELQVLTAKVWRVLIEELGTDHWYAIRHRGEEEQVYSDPCRSVTKAEGFLQAFAVMKDVDPKARITVWSWGEAVPDLFESFPEDVRTVHIRHGMANVFGDRGEGREQADGRPNLPRGRKWLSGQFTVFGGNETGLRTAWCDAASLHKDAAASSADPDCDGYFQWPEWSDTSPWLSDVIARLAWDPGAAPDFLAYARARHGELSEPFSKGFLPLVQAGNARFMAPPRKRLLVPFLLAEESLRLTREGRLGVLAMCDALPEASPLFERDLVDLVTWVGLRQARTFEADAFWHHRHGESLSFAPAREAWDVLQGVLETVPELSILEAAWKARRVGALSDRVEASFWRLGCDFYHGYPLVLSPEAIELCYRPQLDALEVVVRDAEARGETAALEEPGWFWHDFPDRRWADAVRKLPSEDAERFERELKERLRRVLTEPAAPAPPELDVSRLRVMLEHPLPESRAVENL